MLLAVGKNVWWGNQGILGVGNRHDNIETNCISVAFIARDVFVSHNSHGHDGHLKMS